MPAAKTASRKAPQIRRGERRRHERYRLTLQGSGTFVTIPARWSKDRAAFEVTSKDVSLGGMMVHFHDGVRPGDRVRLRFAAGGRNDVYLDAIVRWVRRDLGSPFGTVTAGVAFERDLRQRDIDDLLHVSDRRVAGSAEARIQAVTRQVNLPLRRAVEISVKSLRIRLARSAVTSIVVALAIGFLAYMLSVDAVTERLQSAEILTRPDVSQRYWVAFVSLLVAVVGIINTLYMSVTERYREIGTMKCLGALDRFVVELFLLEAMALGFVGAGAGALLGSLAAMIGGAMAASAVGTAANATLPWLVLGKNFLIATGSGVLLTIVGSAYPAYRASRMMPADAMRTEV